MQRTIDVVTLTLTRKHGFGPPGQIQSPQAITVEMTLQHGEWVVLAALDEDGRSVHLTRFEIQSLAQRANAGEDESGED